MDRPHVDVNIRSFDNPDEADVEVKAANRNDSMMGVLDSNDPCAGVNMSFNCRMIVSEFKASDHWFNPSTEAMLVTFYCIVIVLGILGNAIVCYIVLRFKHLQKPRNILIFNLSACGIMMCVLCMPFSLLKLTLKNWHLGDFMCRLGPTVQTIDVFVSTFSIVAIAVDRYSAIVCASQEATNKKLVYYSITLMWLVSILLCVPMLSFHEVHDVYSEVYPAQKDIRLYKICMEVWPTDVYKKIYTTCVLLVQYIAPLSVISILHCKICQFLRFRINNNPKTETEFARVMRDIKRQKKNMLLLTAIAVTFAISWLPLTILNTLADYDYTLFMNRSFNLAYAYCLLAAMCSACLNPLIYGWFNSNFRSAFIHVLCPRMKTSGSGTLEMATMMKSDSRGSSPPRPYKFYSSVQLESGSGFESHKMLSLRSKHSSNRSSRSSSRSNKSEKSLSSEDACLTRLFEQ